ncbi:F-box associated interaction domain [Arabidopsis suecica]|uniref:F-box associated interaction domain n=1 Tax=Arabidopsis suecica TaxID=45249 RepID=A0A8T2AL56_ARASU|nr:F-box associated interaction domain [Arabidopsis suecica]
MTTMLDLPRELVEEILCRVPVKSMRTVRLTCKTWNTLSNHIGKAAPAREGEFLAIWLANFRVYLMSFSHNNSDSSIKPRGKLISLTDPDDVDIVVVCFCEGLLLCTTKDMSKIVVWNPYSGQTRWICVEPRFFHNRMLLFGHALGYDKNKSHKILRFSYSCSQNVHEIFEFKSNSWRVLDVTPDSYIEYYECGVSLKGNMYWKATYKTIGAYFLLCFDFTKERFGPHLPLPFESNYDVVTLSPFGEEQLAVLFQPFKKYGMEIWVTTKIEPSEVSWSKFLAVVDMRPLYDGSFLIDEEKRAVMVFDGDENLTNLTRYKAYIIGEKRYFKAVDLGEITEKEGFLAADCLISVNLHGSHNSYDPFINYQGKLISLNNSDDVVISRICNCEGLLLCTTGDYTRLVVWNPYTGQTRWICIERNSGPLWCHALGYEKSGSCRRIHKILRFAHFPGKRSVHEIYEFNSNSWRVLDVTPDCYDVVTLSTFGEEQLAVLVQPFHSYGMEIWVTNNIEPNAVSWSKFLAVVDMGVLIEPSFLIHKEKQAVVVFDEHGHSVNHRRHIAYIVGENGYFRPMDLGVISDRESLSCVCSYVPSSVLF